MHDQGGPSVCHAEATAYMKKHALDVYLQDAARFEGKNGDGSAPIPIR